MLLIQLEQRNNELYLLLRSTKPVSCPDLTSLPCVQIQQAYVVLQIQLEQRKLALAELKTKDLDERLASQLTIIKTEGGINAAQDRSIALQKEVKRLESRRQQASIKFNEAITHNRKLREQIDSLRRERLVFDGIYKKLEKELQVCYPSHCSGRVLTSSCFDSKTKNNLFQTL